MKHLKFCWKSFLPNKDTSDAIENASTIIYLCFVEVDKSKLNVFVFAIVSS